MEDFDSRPGHLDNRLKTSTLQSIKVAKNDLVTLLVTVKVALENFSIVDSNSLKYYRPARLIIPPSTAVDQRWYIEFYVFDAQKGKIVRRRVFNVPPGKNRAHREVLGKELANLISKHLRSGKIIDRSGQYLNQVIEKNENDDLIDKRDIQSILREYPKLKKFTEARTRNTYLGILNKFNKFVDHKAPVVISSELNLSFCKEYVDYLESDQCSPRTINNHISTLRTVFNELVSWKYLKSNPWLELKKLKTPMGKNIAYLPGQIEEILAFSEKTRPQINFLIKFMYYTLARTNEIAQIKVKHIGMYVSNKIYIPQENSKNDMERHIIIPPGLEREFEKYDIRSLNPEWYIFSKAGLLPGPRQARSAKLGESYRYFVTDKLNYPKEYTLYSWKHTGVISAHKAGAKDDDIMQQTGHKDYGSFQKYLKSLGLYDNDDFANKIPEL